MNIRSITKDDIEPLCDIHDKFYKHEFEFPDFDEKFYCAYVVTDDNDKIITLCAIRPIAEVIALTDKNFSTRKRINAHHESFNVAKYIALQYNHNQIHAFVQDSKWLEQLKTVGFKSTKGQSLVLNV